jgi:hypothetical protein
VKKELEDKLCKEFPTFFHREKAITHSLMAFGFEHGDGWYDILHSLCKDIVELLKQYPYPEFEVIQVKEKFGTLRFYVNGAHNKIHKRIMLVEEQSAHTCEICGKPGKTRGHAWLYTACQKHTKEGAK